MTPQFLRAARVLLVAVALTACAAPAPPAAPAPAAPPTSASPLDGVAEAKKTVTTAMVAATEFRAPGPAFDASKAKGKTIWYIQYRYSSPTTALWRETTVNVVKDYGVKVIEFDGKGQVAEHNRGIQQAVAAKADLIFLMGIDPNSVTAAINEAKEAKIPVVLSSAGLPGIPSSPPGVVATVTINHVDVGKLLADWMVADSNGAVEAVIITHEGVLGTSVLVDGINSELRRICPKCNSKTQNLPFTEINNEPAVTQSLVVQNPALRYIVPVYDFEMLAMAPALQQAGAAERVKLASFNALDAVLKVMAKQPSPIKADVGSPNVWYGYAQADQCLRILSGVGPVADELLPLRLFTTENIGQLDLAAGEAAWYGPVDFKAAFAKLWGAR